MSKEGTTPCEICNSFKCECDEIKVRKHTLKLYLRDLAKNILYHVTKQVEPVLDEDGKNIAERERKNQVRNIKNILKEKLKIWEMIKKVETEVI